MKNRLLPLFVVLGCYSAYSQVGIGTKTPNASAQLEITVDDNNPKKGVLIPRVKLMSTIDTGTIVKSNDPNQQPYVNSLLVFATDKVGDITPGYYYWYIDKWNRMAVSGESGSGSGNDGRGVVSAIVDPTTGDLIITYTDGTTVNAGKVKGEQGPQGPQGEQGIAGVVGVQGMTGT
ncbi:hypothetical protein AR687_02450 [Flavobacteriaceae bacterium CRH]|nr:hypothetical protein AR687_02450 [Flavobacteriaceae bacterium CRH]